MLLSYFILWVMFSIGVGWIYHRKTGSLFTAVLYGGLALMFQVGMYLVILLFFFPSYLGRI